MIQVNGLTKRFGDFPAISGLDCTIPEGCVYGLVGANGAGKSTLLRLICGIYRPDKGNVTLDGKNIYENPPRLCPGRALLPAAVEPGPHEEGVRGGLSAL